MLKEDPECRTTVVYIEADRASALLMQYLLGSRANYVLHHAIDGLSGLEICRRVSPDLVITEMYLPDVTAYEVLQALRSSPGTKGMPCIVLSSDAMPNHVERALSSGFDGYWTKPIDIWHLLQNIEDAATGELFRRQEKCLKKGNVRTQVSQPVNWSSAMSQNY